MKIKTITTRHFVVSEHLNHHGTLFAGRAAEWFVEAGLMSAAECVPADNIVLVKINSMNFIKPVRLGETLCLDAAVVYAGRTSMVSHIRAHAAGTTRLEGFITYVNVDAEGHSQPHGLELETANEDEAALSEQARNLPR